MLGRHIHDPDGIEGPPQSVEGLGHLDVETVMKPHKRLALTGARHIDSGAEVRGYEIHIGDTEGPDRARAWLAVGAATEGAASDDGKVLGCYLHGLFAADGFRAAYLERLGTVSDIGAYDATVNDTLDHLAQHLEDHLDIDALLGAAGEVS